MLTGALLLAAFSWSERAISIFDRIANSRFLKRFTGGIMGRLEEYKDSSQKTRSAIPEIFGLTMVCWVLKGFEWYFLGAALGITISSNFAIAWLGFFLIHPLVTALAFVPITPAGAGVQEFGIVGILSLLFVNPSTATLGAIGAFAILGTRLTNHRRPRRSTANRKVDKPNFFTQKTTRNHIAITCTATLRCLHNSILFLFTFY